jgi:hypothetical protein
MVRRLDDGLRGEIKCEIKTLSEYLAWHLEVGGQAARGGRRRRLATVGRRGRKEGDGADRRAPHGSDVRERRCLCQSAQSQREYAFREIRQRGLGRVGRARVRRPVGEAIGSVRLGRTGGEKEVGRGWAGKRIREEAGPKSRKRVSELKLDF